MIDVSDAAEEEPVEQYKKIRNELSMYNKKLTLKHHAIVATKLDIVKDRARLDMLEKYCKTNNTELFKISSVTGNGIKKLLNYVNILLKEKSHEKISN